MLDPDDVTEQHRMHACASYEGIDVSRIPEATRHPTRVGKVSSKSLCVRDGIGRTGAAYRERTR